MNKKYTKENLSPVIAESKSWKEVAQKLKLSFPSGSASRILKLSKEWGLDTSHFVGKSHAKGKEIGFKYPIEDYLSNLRPISSNSLKFRLFKECIKPRCCESCQLSEWLGDKIPVELHHVDGDPLNNNLNNLQILCPNCHSKTNNHAGKNIKTKTKISAISEAEILSFIPTVFNIRELLLKLSLSATGANYKRINTILSRNPLVKFKVKSKILPLQR